ncbi:Fic family protein [Denitratimonas sp. CY0512]|uniref:Fic family protein n=1 Tax=Denitratimonas sp. CY0512 TaxID=3131940 RepID=UPI003095F372
MTYQPPYTLTSDIVSLVAAIAEQVGRLSLLPEQGLDLRLRRINRIRTVTGSLAIEGNTLSEEQITALLEGKTVLAPPRELQEARNALLVYEHLSSWGGSNETDLLAAHRLLMTGLLDHPGQYRASGVGVMAGDKVLHMAPPANRVPVLMRQLFGWLGSTREHPLIASSVFHYEFEFIHPFADGNGRMGRLWQTLLLSRWQPALAWLPVESLIHQRQAAYYQALNDSTAATDCAPFIQFMLTCIRQALDGLTPQDTRQVTPQVEAVLAVMRGEMTRHEIQIALGLADRENFRKVYLLPALATGLVEMTLPDKPNSRNQRYRLTVLGHQRQKMEPRTP